VAAVERLGVMAALKAYIKQGRPFFGICLGMQMLFESSEETPGVQVTACFDAGRRLGFTFENFFGHHLYARTRTSYYYVNSCG